MSMSDPIADMLTRVRNAQLVNKKSVQVPTSKIKTAMIKVLLAEGYIESFTASDDNRITTIILKYYQDKSVIEKINRISKPGLRVYENKDTMPSVIGGMGIVIVSTSKGVMTGQQASAKQIGGEILCSVY